jgi:hypothetical protein
MVIKISVFMFLIFTTSSVSNESINISPTSNKQAKISTSDIDKLITDKPKRVFSLSENKPIKSNEKPKNKDKKFIPTESISEDLSVPFPVDI